MNILMHRRPMSAWHLIRHSLAYHWRTHAAVALGVMAATTVLVGADRGRFGPRQPGHLLSTAWDGSTTFW